MYNLLCSKKGNHPKKLQQYPLQQLQEFKKYDQDIIHAVLIW